MDWAETTQPILYLFPRGVSRDGGKVGAQDVVQNNPARWTSQYGSVIVSAYGLASVDGINEAGLGMHLLFLTATDFGTRDATKSGVHAGLWGQYLLDNAATVEQALHLLRSIQPVMVEHAGYKTSLHLAIEDSTGESAIIEYVDGKAQIFHGPEHRVMTNDPPYSEQLLELKKWDFQNATRETPLPGNVNPIDRFVRANYFLQTLRTPQSERAAIATVFSIARNASVPFNAPYKHAGTIYDTEYRTVASLSGRRYFFELTTSPNVVWIDLARVDFSPAAPVRALDPDSIELVGDVSQQFTPVHTVPF